MTRRILFVIILSLSSIFLTFANEEKSNTLTIRMPDAVATRVDDYLCTSMKLDGDQLIYITGFEPSANSKDAHHMLLYGCSEPGNDEEIWDCGEMNSNRTTSSEKYQRGPACRTGSTVIYAWALDAEKTELPKDVAFRIGGSTSIKYLVLQVHYANLRKFEAGEKDRSGFILNKSPTPTTKSAGVLLLVSNGRIEPKSEELFEIACPIEQDIVLHPFAYRVHTHKLGLLVSGYRVRGENEEQKWTELGRRSPRLPQMFNQIKENLTIEKGDYVAAACTMFNTKFKMVQVGPTGDDEMCNFYLMYWVEGDRLLDDPLCFSAGPPSYYFRKTNFLNVDRIPEDAFRPPQLQFDHQHVHQLSKDKETR